MRLFVFLVLTVVAIGSTVLLVIVLRTPEVRNDINGLGHDFERGARDAADNVRDAAKKVAP